MLPKNAIFGGIGALGTVMVGAAGVSPDQAKSNLESWAIFLKLDGLAPLVQGPSADTIAMGIGAALIFGSGVFFFVRRWRGSKPALPTKADDWFERDRLEIHSLANLSKGLLPTQNARPGTLVAPEALPRHRLLKDSVAAKQLRATLNKDGQPDVWSTVTLDDFGEYAVASGVDDFVELAAKWREAHTRLRRPTATQQQSVSAPYDRPMWQAVEYVAGTISEAASIKCYEKARKMLRQAAGNGEIKVYGRRELPNRAGYCSDLYTYVDAGYWAKYLIGEMATSRDWTEHEHTRPEYGVAADRYWSLMVNWQEILAKWPEKK